MLTGRKRDDAPNLIASPDSMHRIAVLLAVLGGTLAAGPALAQLGAIFGDSPPRPPASVPNGSFPPQPPPVQYPSQSLPSPPAQYPAQSSAAAGAVSRPSFPRRLPDFGRTFAIQHPGAAFAAASRGDIGTKRPAEPRWHRRWSRSTHRTTDDAATGRRAVTPGTNPPPPQPADTSPPPDDTVITEMPTQKIENSRAVFSGLDKITGRIISFDAAIGETVQFGALQVTARVCYTRPPTEATNTDAFVQVDEVTLQGEVKRIFSGWMFAASPGLHAVEHPIYDVWLTDCASPIKVAEPAAPPAPAARPRVRPHHHDRARPRHRANSPPPAVEVQPR